MNMGVAQSHERTPRYAARTIRRSVASALPVLAAVLALSSATSLRALSTTQPTSQWDASAGPCKVYVGLYVNQLHSVDIKGGKYTVDLWVWFRWQDERCDPIETFELINAQVESKQSVTKKIVAGWHYSFCRVTATVSKQFDVSRFPFDQHRLTLAIEDTEHEDFKVRFIPGVDNTATDPEVRVPGWDIRDRKTAVESHAYNTNYGDISLPTGNTSKYSRFTYSFTLCRQGNSWGHFFRLFWSVFLAVMISLAALFLKPDEVDPRFGLGVGAIFASVASVYIISSSLPDTNQMTMADMVSLVGVSFIFLTVLESILALRLFRRGHRGAAIWLDRACRGLFALGYVAATLFVVL